GVETTTPGRTSTLERLREIQAHRGPGRDLSRGDDGRRQRAQASSSSSSWASVRPSYAVAARSSVSCSTSSFVARPALVSAPLPSTTHAQSRQDRHVAVAPMLTQQGGGVPQGSEWLARIGLRQCPVGGEQRPSLQWGGGSGADRELGSPAYVCPVAQLSTQR